MRGHRGMWMLAARGSILWVLVVLVLTSGAELALFWRWMGAHSQPALWDLVNMVSESKLLWAAGAGLAALSVVLSRNGCQGGSVQAYTLRRLSMREEAAVLWWTAHNSACFLIFWAAQLGTALVICKLYFDRMYPGVVEEITPFVYFYRSRYLHALLPLSQLSLWLRNLLLVLALGLSTAMFSYKRRHGKLGISAVVMTLLVAVLFPCGLERGEAFYGMLLAASELFYDTLMLVLAWKGGQDETEAV